MPLSTKTLHTLGHPGAYGADRGFECSIVIWRRSLAGWSQEIVPGVLLTGLVKPEFYAEHERIVMNWDEAIDDIADMIVTMYELSGGV